MNTYIVREVIYPIYRALKRDRVLDFLAEMHRVEVLDPEDVRKFQWAKFKRLLEYAAEHVPYYRGVFKDLGATPEDFKSHHDLKGFPVLRKRDILANPEAFISEAYPRSRLERNSTGGSTGENLYFWLDREVCQARQANNARMDEWIDIRIGDRVAMLWGTAFDMERSRKVTNVLRNWVSNRLLLSSYTMDLASLDDYVNRLTAFRPHLILSYPSALIHFCRSVAERGGMAVKPRAVLCSGETLYDWQRDVIEDTFGTACYNHYGCREFGALARECRMRDGLHIACERVLIEEMPVSDSTSGAQASELLVTDLDAYGMPFIRYAIGDLGKITWEQCKCGLGLPRLQSTLGRTFDVVRTPNGNYLGGTFWTILLRKRKGIERFQVIQEKIDEITIAFIPTEEFTDDTRRYIIDKVREAGGPEMKVKFEPGPDLALTPAGKFRFVISKIGLPDGNRDD